MTDRQRITSGSPYEPRIGFTRALRCGSRVVAGLLGPRWRVKIEAEADRPGTPGAHPC